MGWGVRGTPPSARNEFVGKLFSRTTHMPPTRMAKHGRWVYKRGETKRSKKVPPHLGGSFQRFHLSGGACAVSGGRKPPRRSPRLEAEGLLTRPESPSPSCGGKGPWAMARVSSRADSLTASQHLCGPLRGLPHCPIVAATPYPSPILRLSPPGSHRRQGRGSTHLEPEGRESLGPTVV